MTKRFQLIVDVGYFFYFFRYIFFEFTVSKDKLRFLENFSFEEISLLSLVEHFFGNDICLYCEIFRLATCML